MKASDFEKGLEKTYNEVVTPQSTWEEELQSEVMEHYLLLAEMTRHAVDKKQHMEEMREQWEKLKDFIRNVEQKAEERGRMEQQCEADAVERGDIAQARLAERAALIEKLDDIAYEYDDGRHIKLYINWDEAKKLLQD